MGPVLNSYKSQVSSSSSRPNSWNRNHSIHAISRFVGVQRGIAFLPTDRWHNPCSGSGDRRKTVVNRVRLGDTGRALWGSAQTWGGWRFFRGNGIAEAVEGQQGWAAGNGPDEARGSLAGIPAAQKLSADL